MGFNSFHNTSSDLNARAVYLQSNNNGFFINNIYANTGGGLAFYGLQTSTVASSDYNNFYATGSTLAYLSGNYATLADFQSGTGHDNNSFSVAPLFVSPTDLHAGNPALDNSGVSAYGVTDDIDGDIRDTVNPDIGADEFVLPALDAAVFEVNAPTLPI